MRHSLPDLKGREGIIAADTKPLTAGLQSPDRQRRQGNTNPIHKLDKGQDADHASQMLDFTNLI